MIGKLLEEGSSKLQRKSGAETGNVLKMIIGYIY